MAKSASQEHPSLEIKETAPLSPTGLLSQKTTLVRQGVRADKPNMQEKKPNKQEMGTQRNNPQLKETRNPQKDF